MVCQLHNDVMTRDQSFLENEKMISMLKAQDGSYQMLSAKTLCSMFSRNFDFFERYLYQILEKLFLKYPMVNRKYIDKVFAEFRLFEVCEYYQDSWLFLRHRYLCVCVQNFAEYIIISKPIDGKVYPKDTLYSSFMFYGSSLRKWTKKKAILENSKFIKSSLEEKNLYGKVSTQQLDGIDISICELIK